MIGAAELLILLVVGGLACAGVCAMAVVAWVIARRSQVSRGDDAPR